MKQSPDFVVVESAVPAPQTHGATRHDVLAAGAVSAAALLRSIGSEREFQPLR